MKKIFLSIFAVAMLVAAVSPAEAQYHHRHRHCYYRHHHRVCRYN